MRAASFYLVVLDSEVRKRGCRTNDANFGIGPLVGIRDREALELNARAFVMTLQRDVASPLARGVLQPRCVAAIQFHADRTAARRDRERVPPADCAR